MSSIPASDLEVIIIIKQHNDSALLASVRSVLCSKGVNIQPTQAIWSLGRLTLCFVGFSLQDIKFDALLSHLN